MALINIGWIEPETGIAYQWAFSEEEIEAIAALEPASDSESVVILKDTGGRVDVSSDRQNLIVSDTAGTKAVVEARTLIDLARRQRRR